MARHVVAATLPAWDLPALADDAQLIVSELVANAYRHAPGTDSFELELVRHPDRLRLSLADGFSIRPVIAELDPDRPTGRGLRIVQALADALGADDHHGGKRVWVELRTIPTVPGPRGAPPGSPPETSRADPTAALPPGSRY
jgi:Histidine kinase-like ATPase domain